MNVDIAIAVGIFIIMITTLIYTTVQYVSQIPIASRISEYREKAIDVFEKLFQHEGKPETWEKQNLVPSQVGLKTTLREIIIIIIYPSIFSISGFIFYKIII